MVILYYVPIAAKSHFRRKPQGLHTNVCWSRTQQAAQLMDVLQTVFFTNVSLIVANVGKSCLFEMIQITEHLSQPLYESSGDLWAAVAALLCQAEAVSHMRSQEGQEVVPVCFVMSEPALGMCSWQKSEHISLHFHFVGEVFVKAGEEWVWLAFICMQLYGCLVRMKEELGRR